MDLEAGAAGEEEGVGGDLRDVLGQHDIAGADGPLALAADERDTLKDVFDDDRKSENTNFALLAHIGSYVPATAARLSPLDRIFTRIGSADDLASGRSTFMVEMTEAANILNNATPKSLVLLDEIGRGTSTFDGISIAWACRTATWWSSATRAHGAGLALLALLWALPGPASHVPTALVPESAASQAVIVQGPPGAGGAAPPRARPYARAGPGRHHGRADGSGHRHPGLHVHHRERAGHSK